LHTLAPWQPVQSSHQTVETQELQAQHVAAIPGSATALQSAFTETSDRHVHICSLEELGFLFVIFPGLQFEAPLHVVL